MKLHNALPVLLILFLLQPLFGQQDDHLYREIEASAPVNLVQTFRLETKGGDIRIQTSEGDSVRVLVRMTTDQILNEDAIERLERIAILDTLDGNRWEWRTDLDGMAIEAITGIVEIDYEISLPDNIILEIVHRNGDLTVADRVAPVWLDLRFGSLSAGCLSGNRNRIDLQMAKANIACLGDAEIDLTGASFRLGTVNNCSIRSKGAEVDIHQAGDVDIRAHAGEYQFRKATTISGSLTSSRIQVDTLLQKGDLDLTLMLGAEFGLAERTERLALETDMAPVQIVYPGERPIALDLEARRDDLRDIDIAGIPEAEDLPDNKVRYRTDWSTARSAEPMLELKVHSKRGKVQIRQRTD